MGSIDVEKYRMYFKISYAVSAFFPILSVIFCYVIRSDVRGDAILFSHCKWQIATFWMVLIGGIVGGLLCIMLAFVLPIIGVLLAYPFLFALWGWCLYRVIKGFMALDKNSPIGVTAQAHAA